MPDIPTEDIMSEIESVLGEFGAWAVPGYAFPAMVIIGLFYLLLGERICTGVIAGLCFVAGAWAGYYFSENIAIAVASGVGAAVIALVVQYVIAIILAGMALGGIASLVAYMMGEEELAPFFALGGFIVGAILAVKLYRILLIFATAALGAACVAPCALVLLDETQRPAMTEFVTLENISLDFHTFSIVFFALLAAGIVIQGISLAYRKTAKQAA
jgi:hypothetical protein